MTKEQNFEIISDQLRVIRETLKEINEYLDNMQEAAIELNKAVERRGKWREIGKSAECVMVYCSVCGDSLAFPIEEPYNFKYCPFCGAKMED